MRMLVCVFYFLQPLTLYNSFVNQLFKARDFHCLRRAALINFTRLVRVPF